MLEHLANGVEVMQLVIRRKLYMFVADSTPDGLPPIMFEQLFDSIALPPSLLPVHFISTSPAANEWRISLVGHIYKYSSSSEVGNYRPIFLTCVACKLIERVIDANSLVYLHQQ